MKNQLCVIACVFGCGTTAIAQDVTIKYSIKWDKAIILSNGDSNTAGVYAEIVPGLGTSVPWTTLPGKGQPGTIKAFASSVFDILAIQGGNAGTLQWTIPTALNLANIPGSPNGQGGITGANAGQVGVPLNPNPVLDNPVKIMDLKWTHNGNPFTTIEFQAKATSGKVFLDVGLASWVGHNAKFLVEGNGGFSIPSPSAWAVLGLAGVMTSRRRRE